MTGWSLRLPAVLLAGGMTVASPSRADDATRAGALQRQVASIMEVLRLSHADPVTSCATALDEMHTTDDQLQQLSGAMQYDNETAPVLNHNANEMGIGRDVLISDMEATVSACRPQADTACAAPSSTSLGASCGRLARSFDTRDSNGH